jgi:DNA polymerase-3 subunit delta
MADTPTFYLIYGDDDLTIDETIAQIRAELGEDPNAELNTSEFEGENTSVDEILNAVSSFTFLSDMRTVFVRGFVAQFTSKGAGDIGKKEMQRLQDALPDLPDYARLILIERQKIRKDSTIVKYAQNNKLGWAKACEMPEDSTDWILARAKNAYGNTIDPKAATALASVIGGDLQRADNELAKLAAYVNDERPISEDDVALLTPYVAEANIFNMVDALAQGNGAYALSLMNTILEQDPSDPGFRLYALIVRQFRLLLLVREHLALGGSRDNNSIASAVGIRSGWQAGKLAKQSRAFKLSQLEQIYRRLQRYDEDMKTGKIEPRLALDLLVASLSKPVKRGRR